jgi:glycosyltransferase involved in cell wall biosynthesis
VPPRVSVVIPTLNRLAFLQEAVGSVQAQTGPATELIVVDDGSSDGTRDWLAARDDLGFLTAERDPDRSAAANTSAARNVGLAHARGEHVWFLDDDDVLKPGAIAALSSALDEHPAAVIAVGARTRFGEGVVGGRIAHPLRLVAGDLGPELLLGWGWVPSQALCRASALRQAGGWREDVWMSEDSDMWLRLCCHGPVVLAPQTVVGYRVHAAQERKHPGIVRDELARPHLAQLAGGSRVRGRRLRSAGRRWERAIVAFDAGDHGLALRSTIAAAVRSPRLLRSPATGPAATRMIARSALRSWGPTRRWVQARPAPRPTERPRRGTGFFS